MKPIFNKSKTPPLTRKEAIKKRLLTFSVILNIVFVILVAFIIDRKGGVDYIKSKLETESVKGLIKYDTDYYNSKKSIFEVMPNDSNEIIFLGNSITNYCDWNEFFGNPKIKNRGINGDMINGIIERIDEVVESKPEKIFLMIGINDLGRYRTRNQILNDYERLISLITEKTPTTTLYIQSILPTDGIHANNDAIIMINERLKLLCEKHELTYINVFDSFKTAKNKLNPKYTLEGIHLNGEGYLVWKKELDKYMD
jgi:hypothetical protein